MVEDQGALMECAKCARKREADAARMRRKRALRKALHRCLSCGADPKRGDGVLRCLKCQTSKRDSATRQAVAAGWRRIGKASQGIREAWVEAFG